MQKLFVELPTARRLRPHEDIAESEARNQQATLMNHASAGKLAPASQAFDTRGNQALCEVLDLLGGRFVRWARCCAGIGEPCSVGRFELLKQPQSSRTGAML